MYVCHEGGEEQGAVEEKHHRPCPAHEGQVPVQEVRNVRIPFINRERYILTYTCLLLAELFKKFDGP